MTASATSSACAAASAPAAAPLVLVTGMSGAGNSTAIRALEDMGFEAIDNLPLSFMDRLFPDPPAAAEAPVPATAPAPDARPLALGIDVRTRGFSAEALLSRLEALRVRPDISAALVFLDCAEPALLDRFKTTRRRHPLAPAEGVGAGIARERELLWPVRERADLVIDTTELTPHDLKARLAELAAPGAAPRLAVSVQSFSFKRGAPREADTVFDCRFLRNPHWSPELRALDGRDAPVAEHVAGDPLYAEFMDRILGLTLALLPAYRREGKAYYCIALGCSGGRHRSVAAAESLAAGLRAAGWATALRHRELGEGAGAAPERGMSAGGAA